MRHRGIGGGEHKVTGSRFIQVLIASNIPIGAIGVIRVGEIIAFPTMKVDVDPTGEHRFLCSSRTLFQCRVALSFEAA